MLEGLEGVVREEEKGLSSFFSNTERKWPFPQLSTKLIIFIGPKFIYCSINFPKKEPFQKFSDVFRVRRSE